MNDYDTARAIREEAQVLSFHVGAQRAVLAATGQRDQTLDQTAERLSDVLMRAGTIEADETPLMAAMETLDPEEFGRRVRARRRMAALRKRRQTPPPVEPLSAAVVTKVVRRG